MDDFLERYADRLGQQAGAPVEPVDAASASVLLELARLVAHGTERPNAPLATYLAGQFLAVATAAGTAPEDALAAALQVARQTLEPLP